MKVLYIITQADGGGAQQYVLQLAKHFHGEIAAGTKDSKLYEAAAKLGIKTHPLKHLKRNIRPVSDFLALIEIIDLIKNIKPDIVHLNSTKAGVLGSLSKIFIKSKIVFTAHGFIFNEPFPPLKKQIAFSVEKFASFFRDYIIAVSNADRRSALVNKLISPAKISTIHNGIAPINFLAHDEARAQLRIPEHLFVFGATANLYSTKAIDVLIEAVSLLPEEIRGKTQWIVLGEGMERQNLENKIKNLGLQKSVLLPGKIENAKQYIKAFDVFVLSSRKEGFPYSLLEAMQAGLPIIATNVGGITEALGDAGMVVKPEDPEALNKAMHGIFVNAEVKNILSQKSLERSKLFTEEKMLEETEEVYKKVLNN